MAWLRSLSCLPACLCLQFSLEICAVKTPGSSHHLRRRSLAEDGIIPRVDLTPLGPNTVIVVSIRLDEKPSEVFLSAEEQLQADRFVFDRDRRRFIAAHTAMRLVLAHYLDIHPLELRFEAGARGKPRLVQATRDLRFNLSHSEERALLAVSVGREVGVDIEYVRTVPDMFGVADTAFSPLEIARLHDAPGDQQAEVFFRVWTRKESFIKALGDGMHFPLKEFDVSTEPSGPQLLLACSAAPAELDRWTTRALPSETHYAAAITVGGKEFDVVSASFNQ